MIAAAAGLALLVVTAESATVPPILSALCPTAVPGEIVVCADAEPPKSPYRLPLPVSIDRGSRNALSVSRERNALFDFDDGMLSCSPSGASGGAGCGFKRHKAWVEQRAGARSGGGRIYDVPPY